MPSVTAPAPRLVERAKADQIATLFTQWPVSTASMLLGAAILATVMWRTIAPPLFAAWVAAIIANQAWRLWLVRCYAAAAPEPAKRLPWGRAWAIGSMLAGALWGVAGVALFVSGDPGHQALLIVCLFGVILGGIKLTAVYKPSLYAFVLPALVPLIVRVAMEGDELHGFIAAVMLVALAFILGFGHSLNDVLTRSLTIRHESTDLIDDLQAKTAAARHDLRQPLHALGLFAAALDEKVREPQLKGLVGSISASVDALERRFSALMDISKRDVAGRTPSDPLTPASTESPSPTPLIAVVSCDAILIEAMRASLAQSGATVVGAASARQMLEALGECGRYPDLVVADDRLADDELGSDAVAMLRDELGLAIPSLLLVGESGRQAISAACAVSVEVLVKPVASAELWRKVGEILVQTRPCAHAGLQDDRPKKSASKEAPEDRPSSG